ncbi:hypothetical protein [Flammeovirga agarivorans]|uniref:Uncharacterized protein n=1 Tax=Flammeovirga agarivorans TaxID=2726742 RepID=A0A7X8XUG5_9BACT|nr:hypothetical protein [Flammeovirga agarivorans]NLR90229.1 hypothetical protein [Flammeovirga agarivorans]
MEEFDLKDIWNKGHQTTPVLDEVKLAAQKQRKKSISLVDTILQKSKLEWVIVGVIYTAIGVPLIINGRILIVILGVLPMLYFFVLSLKNYKKVRAFDTQNTLEYLKKVDSFIDRSLQIYAKQLKVLIPYSLLFGMYIALQNIIEEEGVSFSEFYFEYGGQEQIIGVLIFFIIIFIPFWRFATKSTHKFIDKFYGKELKGIKSMIEELQSEQ